MAVRFPAPTFRDLAWYDAGNGYLWATMDAAPRAPAEPACESAYDPITMDDFEDGDVIFRRDGEKVCVKESTIEGQGQGSVRLRTGRNRDGGFWPYHLQGTTPLPASLVRSSNPELFNEFLQAHAPPEQIQDQHEFAWYLAEVYATGRRGGDPYVLNRAIIQRQIAAGVLPALDDAEITEYARGRWIRDYSFGPNLGIVAEDWPVIRQFLRPRTRFVELRRGFADDEAADYEEESDAIHVTVWKGNAVPNAAGASAKAVQARGNNTVARRAL